MLEMRPHVVVGLFVRPNATVALATAHGEFLPVSHRSFCPNVERFVYVDLFPLIAAP
jgi:hypothetical protein